MRLLVVEDHPSLAQALVHTLSEASMAPLLCRDGICAQSELTMARHGGAPFDAVVLDLSLPDRDGLEVLRDMRAAGDSTPVLVLTARASIDHRVTGLEAGADDYLTKPYDPRELVARLRALLRRKRPDGKTIIQCGNLAFDLTTSSFRVGSHELHLAHTLSGLSRRSVLHRLLDASPRVVSRESLRNIDPHGATDQALNSAIQKLRERLAEMGSTARIVAVYGEGFRLVAAGPESGPACDRRL